MMIGIASLKLDPALSDETVAEFVHWYRNEHVPEFLKSANGAVKARRLDPMLKRSRRVSTLYEFAEGVDAVAFVTGPIAKVSFREYWDTWGVRLGKTEFDYEVYEVANPAQVK